MLVHTVNGHLKLSPSPLLSSPATPEFPCCATAGIRRKHEDDDDDDKDDEEEAEEYVEQPK